jgi:hypothetical protein
VLPAPVEIPPFTVNSVDNDIDFFLDFEAPSDIMVQNTKPVLKYWLHAQGSEQNTPEAKQARIREDSAITHAVQVDFSKVNASLDQKTVIIEGYLLNPSESFGSGHFDFVERQNQSFAKPRLRVDIQIDTAKNSMPELHNGFSIDDVKIIGNDEEEIHVGDRVKITGSINIYPSTDGYYLNCKKIEKSADVYIDYSKLNSTELNPGNITDQSLIGKLIFAEGMLEIPTWIMGSTSTDFDFTIKGHK